MWERKGENGSQCQDLHAREQEALARACKTWYVILVLVPPLACIVKQEPFKLASPLVNLLNFATELGSLSLSHSYLVLKRYSPMNLTELWKRKDVTALCPRTLPWKTALEELKECCLYIKIPHSSSPKFFKLTAAQKEYVN